MKIKSYEEAVKYLESFIGKIKFEITPEFLKHHDPLERMRELLFLLGNPQDKFSSVLIGGTSGKGSTAYLISHILTTAGYKTGLTISPHLQTVNERLQINGQPVSDEQFLRMVSSIVDTIALMKAMSVGAPSYFEIIVAMAFLYFVKEKVDIAVVEVGMGGEFDATNTLCPLVAVLTNVSLDHTSILGKTVQKIAKTKAGIIKKGKGENNLHPPPFTLHPIVVTGVKQASVIKIVEEKSREAGVELYRLRKDFDFAIKKESKGGIVFDLIIFDDRQKKLNGLALSLLGIHQVENASLAIETVLQLEKFGFKVSNQQIGTGLKTAFFPGRFEIVDLRRHPEFISGSRSRNPVRSEASKFGMTNKQVRDDKEKTLILDGAHNPTKMRAFLSTLKKLYPKERKVFVVGFKFDKDVKKMLRQILQVADSIIITEFHGKTDVSNNASAEALNIKSQTLASLRSGSNLKYRKGVKIITLKNSKMALNKALSLLEIQQFNNLLPRRKQGSTIIVVTGSLYLIGEIRNML